jgi:FecR protein
MTRIDELKRAVTNAAVIVACALLPAISSASQDMVAMNAGNTASTTSRAASGGRVYAVNGDVFVIQGNNPSHRVDGNEAIVSNTLVNTGENSSALLKFDDGQIVTMQPNSSFQVREYRYDAKKIENSNIVFSMLKGGMRFVTGLIGKARKQAFRLATPNATIGIRGTEFMVVMSGKSMYSQVLTGKIAMTNAAGIKIVGAGKSAVVASSSALASLVPASAVPSGTFRELLSIPVDPSAIPAPAPEPAPVPETPPVPAAEIGAAASVAGATAGIAGGAIAGMAGSESESTEEATPEIRPEETSEPAPAENAMQAKERSGVGITGKIGTLGLGAELNLAFSDSFGARFGYNAFTYKYSSTASSVDYDFKLQLTSASILGDWYPFEGGFRTSAGLVYNDNQANLTGTPSGGTYDINGTTYNSTDVGSLKGKLSFNNVSPYLGIGWGNPVARDKGWGVVTDIGVLFQGSPKTELVATCGATAPPLTCTQLQSDTAAENARLQSDLKQFKFWPVMSIGISYQW